MKKYVVGIDLGTTHCVVAYVPLDAEKAEVRLLPIEQSVAPSTWENRDSLPSFLYVPTEKECEGTDYVRESSSRGASSSPFTIVGEIARKRSTEVPDRTISAAKSWLCNTKVDRREAILPWNCGEEVPKISPLLATQRLLEQLVESWENAFPDAPIHQQEVVLTVPASFDASARELTREAAIAAGLPLENLLFLEEPQAAIYAWLQEVGEQWRKTLKLGDTLLICDVGGGTTDLTLIGVEEEQGDLVLKRLAVGDHLLVGGDNMDLTLAHHAAELLAEKGTILDPWQSVSLWYHCRAAKEFLLCEDMKTKKNADAGGKSNPDSYPISVLGRGRKLIGGTITVEMQKQRANELLKEGFFPNCEITERPKRRSQSGFRELGLAFEQDTGITRHLGAFLSAHGVSPTHVLLNGGVFKAEPLKNRLFQVLEDWFPDRKVRHLQSLAGLDHAVALGAAYYGWMKNNGGIRIRGGTARSYYVGIETAGLAIPGAPRPLKALCVAPFGMEEGSSNDVPSDEIGLIVGEPAHFRFFSSTTRKEDRPGTLLDSSHITSSEADLQETDSMETELSGPQTDSEEPVNEEYVPVRFQTHITELGMMELWCRAVHCDQKWKLEFSVREDCEYGG